MFNKTKHKGKKYFCKSCLQCFSCENVLNEHKKDCLMINKGENVKKDLLVLKTLTNKFLPLLKFMLILSVCQKGVMLLLIMNVFIIPKI